ncbi:hypothetical protein BC832DRAFT_134967 [Gaertneriomyces semiglobifer]|nr:hypothetical protein BC832DRAFT_134967 [Gaertneriomyces semiglobifer]
MEDVGQREETAAFQDRDMQHVIENQPTEVGVMEQSASTDSVPKERDGVSDAVQDVEETHVLGDIDILSGGNDEVPVSMHTNADTVGHSDLASSTGAPTVSSGSVKSDEDDVPLASLRSNQHELPPNSSKTTWDNDSEDDDNRPISYLLPQGRNYVGQIRGQTMASTEDDDDDRPISQLFGARMVPPAPAQVPRAAATDDDEIPLSRLSMIDPAMKFSNVPSRMDADDETPLASIAGSRSGVEGYFHSIQQPVREHRGTSWDQPEPYYQQEQYYARSVSSSSHSSYAPSMNGSQFQSYPSPYSSANPYNYPSPYSQQPYMGPMLDSQFASTIEQMIRRRVDPLLRQIHHLETQVAHLNSIVGGDSRHRQRPVAQLGPGKFLQQQPNPAQKLASRVSMALDAQARLNPLAAKPAVVLGKGLLSSRGRKEDFDAGARTVCQSCAGKGFHHDPSTPHQAAPMQKCKRCMECHGEKRFGPV